MPVATGNARAPVPTHIVRALDVERLVTQRLAGATGYTFPATRRDRSEIEPVAGDNG